MVTDGLPSLYALALLGLTVMLALAAAAVSGMPAVERIALSDALGTLRAPLGH